jgi:hypothetical protein
MDPGSRRRRTWKVLRFFIGGVLIVVAAAWLWIRSVESRHWSRMEQRVAELRREADARCGPRPVLRGTPIPGDAWDDYFKAIEILKDPQIFTSTSSYASRTPGADRAQAEAALRTLGAAVDLLQNGTKRSESRRVRFHEGEHPFDLNIYTRLGRALFLTATGVCRARFLEEEDKVHEASELILDLFQFGRDVGRDGSMRADHIGFLICEQASRGLKDLLCGGKCSPATLEQIDRELEKLDISFPRSAPSLLGEVEFFGELILNDKFLSHFYSDLGLPLPPEARPGWRFAFSSPLMMTSAFDHADQWVGRMQDVETASSIEEARRWNDFNAEAAATKNIHVITFSRVVLAGHLNTHRTHLTHLRLLRTVAHYYATGKILDLEDPFGTSLHHVEVPDHFRIWGVGRNGKDDGGKGEWSPYAVQDDIILEIPRRP